MINKNRKRDKSIKTEGYYIYGKHAVAAALRNDKREFLSLMALENVSEEIQQLAEHRGLKIEIKGKGDFNEIIGDAVHQGVVLQVQKLNLQPLPALVKSLEARPKATIVVADRISDPQNVGAILRNIAAFGADALLLPTHHAPGISGSLAKAAAGALEIVPIYYQPNLVQSLQFLQKHGFWCYAACENAETDLSKADLASHSVFVLGSESEGIRPLVLKNCDVAVKIPMANAEPESLNVAATSAIMLYHRFISP